MDEQTETTTTETKKPKGIPIGDVYSDLLHLKGEDGQPLCKSQSATKIVEMGSLATCRKCRHKVGLSNPKRRAS